MPQFPHSLINNRHKCILSDFFGGGGVIFFLNKTVFLSRSPCRIEIWTFKQVHTWQNLILTSPMCLPLLFFFFFFLFIFFFLSSVTWMADTKPSSHSLLFSSLLFSCMSVKVEFLWHKKSTVQFPMYLFTYVRCFEAHETFTLCSNTKARWDTVRCLKWC